MAEQTAVDRALKALEGIEQLKQQAIGELLAQRQEIDGKLARLGYEEAPKPKAATGKTGITRQRDPNAPCGVCEFVTVPNHDARKHRSQGDKKKPFTSKELEELGLKKV